MAVPFEGFLGLLAVFVPMVEDDVLACAGQVVGGIHILHLEARGITEAHGLRGIVVTQERESVELAQAGFAVGEAPHVVGDELVLAVGFVPVAHLPFQQVFVAFDLVEDITVFLIDGEGLAMVGLAPL